MFWMQKLRLRVFALIAGLALLAFGAVSVFAIPVIPAVGVAITLAVTMVNTMTSRLTDMTCAGCGQSIAKLPAGTHGIACTKCGAINHPFNAGEPFYAFDLSDDDTEDNEDELA